MFGKQLDQEIAGHKILTPTNHLLRTYQYGVYRGFIGDMENAVLWSVGVWWGGFFYPQFYQSVAQKLRRIILLHGELVTFHFHLSKNPKVFISMTFGPSGHVHDPQNQLLLTLNLYNYSK